MSSATMTMMFGRDAVSFAEASPHSATPVNAASILCDLMLSFLGLRLSKILLVSECNVPSVLASHIEPAYCEAGFDWISREIRTPPAYYRRIAGPRQFACPASDSQQ